MKKLTLILGLAATAISSNAAFGESDHQESRRLMEQGEILPLQQILDYLGQEQVGRVLEVELEQVHGRYIYEIELLGEDGRVLGYEIDAATGKIFGR